MTKKIVAGLVFCVLCAPMGAFAVAPLTPTSGPHTWTEVKEACARQKQPGYQGHQRIHLDCVEVSTHWVEQTQPYCMTTTIGLQVNFSTNKVGCGSEVTSDQGRIQESCSIFTEMRRERDISLDMECEEIEQFNSAADVCRPHLERLPLSEVREVKTGRVLNTCGGNPGNQADLPAPSNAATSGHP
jgi:hypothetical protein